LLENSLEKRRLCLRVNTLAKGNLWQKSKVSLKQTRVNLSAFQLISIRVVTAQARREVVQRNCAPKKSLTRLSKQRKARCLLKRSKR